MKNTSKRIIISVLTLVLTVVALGTTTFAWFSLSNVSKVSGIEGTITGGDGLEVQLSGPGYSSGFKNNLTSAEWEEFMKQVGENFEFQAVTTTGDENHTMTKLAFSGQSETDNKLVLGQGTEANKDYLQFTLTFRSQNAGKINLTSLSFSGEEVTFTPSVEYLQTPDTTGLNTVKTSAANAARISFQADTTIKAYQKAAVDYNVSGEVLSGNSAANEIVENGQWAYLASKNIDIYKKDQLEKKLTFGDLEDIEMLHATGVNGEIDGGDQIVELSKNEDEGHYTASITVRIWIEGWDADTYDAVFNAVLKIDMIFNKVETSLEG